MSLAGMLLAAMVSAAVSSAGQAVASPPAVEDKYLETIKVSDNVYVFKPKIDWIHGNGVAIIGLDGVFFVDTYMQFNYAEEAIRRLQRVTKLPVRYVLNTHWHYDHVMGNSVFKRVFPGCQIIAQDTTARYLDKQVKSLVENDLEAIKGDVAQLDSELQVGHMSNGTPIVGSMKQYWELRIREDREYEQHFHREKFAGADITFGDTLTMHWGPQTLRMVHMTEAGHSPGDVIVWIPETRILISGDLVVGPTPYATYRNIPGMISGIHSLLALNPAVVIPGHGPVAHDLAYMQLLDRAFTEYLHAAEAAVANRVPIKDAADTIAFPEIDRLFVSNDDALTQWAYRTFFVRNLIANTYRYPGGK